VPKDGAFVDQPGSSHGQVGPRSKTLANDEANTDAEKSPEEVAAEQDRVPEVKAKTKTEDETSSQQPPNQTVKFPKPDHLVSSGSGQKRTTAPGMAPTPRWCPPGLSLARGG
jgi:hypothetical protein